MNENNSFAFSSPSIRAHHNLPYRIYDYTINRKHDRDRQPGAPSPDHLLYRRHECTPMLIDRAGISIRGRGNDAGLNIFFDADRLAEIAQ